MQKVVPKILLLSLLLSGCSIFRNAGFKETAKTKNEFKNCDIVSNNISNNNFYIQKAVVTVSEDDVTNKFLATIKYKLPDSLLISIRAKIGIEIARIFMTDDTLIINDRINKKLRVGNPVDLKNKYGIDPSLVFVIFGDFIIAKEQMQSLVKCQNGSAEDQFFVEGKRIDYKIDCKKAKIVSASFGGEINKGNIIINFSEFIDYEGIRIPASIGISNDLSNVKASIQIEKANNNYGGVIGGIKKGSNYEVIRLR
jgi:hypothetical protein